MIDTYTCTEVVGFVPDTVGYRVAEEIVYGDSDYADRVVHRVVGWITEVRRGYDFATDERRPNLDEEARVVPAIIDHGYGGSRLISVEEHMRETRESLGLAPKHHDMWLLEPGSEPDWSKRHPNLPFERVSPSVTR
jgi:hypothetical protein